MKILKIIMVFFSIMTIGASKNQYEIALVTDAGNVNDKSFNQGAWNGINKYAKKDKKTFKFYKPKDKSTDSFINTLDLAVSINKADIIISAGFLFEGAIYDAQYKYKDTSFVLLDASPRDPKTKQVKVEKNTYSIYYLEEQAGFLAGYASVKEGFRNLGFAGGIAVPNVINFLYGYIQGVDYAAKEIGLKKGEVNIKYTYFGNFMATPENQTLASAWYRSGIEVIFACGGASAFSVMAAAEQNNGYVIGVDVDQSGESKTVITSAVKDFEVSVYNTLSDYYKGNFKGGTIARLGLKENAVGLKCDYKRFKKFNKNDYDKIVNMIIEDKIIVKSYIDIADKKNFNIANTDLVNVEFIR